MNQLHMWQIAVDIALVATMLIMSARAIKGRSSTDTGRVMELERSIRSLLSEADMASKALSDTLRERQRSLETLLKDLRESEERIETQSSKVEEKVNRGVKLLGELSKVRASEPKLSEPRPAEAPRPSQKIEIIDEVEDEEGEVFTKTPPPSAPQRNRPPAPQMSKQQVAASTQAPESKQRSIIEMQRVYAHAEKLLKEGMALSQVTAETLLPEEELKLLSQMIEIERSEEEAPMMPPVSSKERDPRLGVLGSMKRQVQTV